MKLLHTQAVVVSCCSFNICTFSLQEKWYAPLKNCISIFHCLCSFFVVFRIFLLCFFFGNAHVFIRSAFETFSINSLPFRLIMQRKRENSGSNSLHTFGVRLFVLPSPMCHMAPKFSLFSSEYIENENCDRVLERECDEISQHLCLSSTFLMNMN